MPYRRGRKSAAQTPAPRSERIKGSKKNPKGSAASKSSAYKIVLSEKTIKALSQKAKDYNKNHKNSVTLNTLKAVYRRGLGAYSSSHRPTITGGVPNTRNAWAMARVNKFLMKKSGKKVKAAYVQDDDLLAKGGNVFDDKELLKRYKKGKSIGFSAEAHLKAKGLIPRADGKKRKSEKYLADGGQVQELMRDGIVEIKMFDTTNEHSKEYGFDAQKPLFIQSIIVSKEHRGKGIGNKVFEYIVDNAKENKYDLIFGHIPQEAEPSIDFIKSMLNKSGFTTIEGNNDFYKIIDIKYEGGGTTLLAPNGKPSNLTPEQYEDDTNILLAPNGEPSKLTPEQYKLVRTPEFKAWFGDWENDPHNSSRVIDDETFEPLVVYHGSPFRFYQFDYNKIGTRSDSGYFGVGAYFTPSKIIASTFGENIYGCFLNVRKLFTYGLHFTHEPYPLSFAEYWKLDHLLYKKDSNGNVNYSSKPYPNKEFSEAVTNKIKKEGYDGIEVYTFDGHQFVVYEPNQIKLADGSNTTFDGNSPDIRYAEGGFNDEVIICSNCLWSWKASESTPEEKYICHKCGHDNKPTMDKITMDVPLFIRLLEFAREDAKDDMELHTLTENALKMGDKTLTMEDYNEIVFSKITSPKITKSTNSLVEFPTIEQEFADGGVVVGKRHSESDEFGTGEKFLVESTGQIVELEGGEGVLCKESMQSWHYYKFDGKEMTGRQIASYLNHKYGGVEFAKGGEVDEKSVCGCRSMYYHGGELPSATLDSLKGGEAVVTVKTMESKDKFQFQGRYMTPRKILSHINQESGGKKFEDGGIIDLTEHHLKNATNMVKMINFTEKIFYF
jgi:GNAT superfamily N-acetyltransferase